MGEYRDRAIHFLAWRKKRALRRITPRFPKPYGWVVSERSVICEAMATTVLQQFSFYASFGGQNVDVREAD